MRRKSAFTTTPTPLVPTSVYLTLVTMIIGMGAIAGFISATKETPRTKVYLPEEWRTESTTQSRRTVEANATRDRRVANYYATID